MTIPRFSAIVAIHNFMDNIKILGGGTMNVIYQVQGPIDGRASIMTFELNGEVWSFMGDEIIMVDKFDEFWQDSLDW